MWISWNSRRLCMIQSAIFPISSHTRHTVIGPPSSTFSPSSLHLEKDVKPSQPFLQATGAWKTDWWTDTSRYGNIGCNSPHIMHFMRTKNQINNTGELYLKHKIKLFGNITFNLLVSIEEPWYEPDLMTGGKMVLRPCRPSQGLDIGRTLSITTYLQISTPSLHVAGAF